jgi:hypothetical protein
MDEPPGISEEYEAVHRPGDEEGEGSDFVAALAAPSAGAAAPSTAAAAATAPSTAPSTASSPACEILRPLSLVAAQRSISLPTSGSLAWLATHQAEHADRGQSHRHDGGRDNAPLLQSDSNVDATTDLRLNFGFAGGSAGGSAGAAEALREFTAAAWQTALIPAHSPSSSSSSRASSVEGSSGLSDQPKDQPAQEHQELEQQHELSPFASIFPDGTSTSPLFVQRCDESETQPSKYSESIQLFRRPDDGGRIWKRRVFEYR